MDVLEKYSVQNLQTLCKIACRCSIVSCTRLCCKP